MGFSNFEKKKKIKSTLGHFHIRSVVVVVAVVAILDGASLHPSYQTTALESVERKMEYCEIGLIEKGYG